MIVYHNTERFFYYISIFNISDDNLNTAVDYWPKIEKIPARRYQCQKLNSYKNLPVL
jgi:hypothetical protein